MTSCCKHLPKPVFLFLFLAIFSYQYSWAQSCSGFGGGGMTGSFGSISTGSICANLNSPVTTQVQLYQVDDVDNPAYVQIQINWGDGSAVQVLTTTSSPALVWGGLGSHSYTLSPIPHTFPATGANVKCEYTATATIFINGTSCGASTFGSAPTFYRYNTDDQKSGMLSITETVTGANVYKVCAGVTTTVTFTDQTTLNCIPPAEMTLQNLKERWRQYTYGTGPPANQITGVLVGGVAQSYPYSEAVLNNTEPTTVLPSPVNTSTITIPPTATVGETFEITMYYWNFCNQYAGSTANAVSTTATILVVAQPSALTPTPLDLCYSSSTSGQSFSVTGLAGGETAINWYNKNPLLGGATLMNNSLGGNSATLPLSDYNAGTNAGVGGTINTSQAGGAGIVYSVWATQVIASTNACESPPVEVVLTVRPKLSTPGTIGTGSNQICVGSTTVAYTLASASPNQTIAANNATNASFVTLSTNYLWSFSNGNASVSSSNTIQNITANFTTAGATTLRVLDQYSTAPNCNTTNSQLPITIYATSVGGSVTPNNTICNDNVTSTGTMTLGGQTGSVVKWQRSLDGGTTWNDILPFNTSTTFSEVPSFGAGSYMYRAVVQSGPCSSTFSNPATITVNPVPPQPTISQAVTSNGLTICEDGIQQTVLQSSDIGLLATSYQWFRNGALVAGQTANQIILNTAPQSGSYTVQVIGASANPTNCQSIISLPTIVTINPLPTASVSGGGSVCSGTPAPDIVWTLTGSPPFNFTIDRSVEGPLVVTGYNSMTYTIVGPLPPASETYQITSLTDNNGCVGTSFGGMATVNITATPPPTPQTFTVTSPVCDDGATTVPPSAILDLSPDIVATYSIGYKLINQNTSVETDVPPSNFTSDINGVVTISPTYVQLGNAPEPLGYQIIITSIFNVTTLCAGAVPINGPILIVNPRPAAPIGAVNSIACSTGGGMPISVTDPGAGLSIMWSTTGPTIFTNAVPGSGAASGSNNSVFTPTSSATATFYAFTQNTASTCSSSSGTAVTQTQDVFPLAANAGPDQPDVCASAASVLLAGNVATNGGIGTWTGPIGVTFGNVNVENTTSSGLTAPVPGGAAIPTTLTWTIASALGVCTNSTDDVIITINPLPTTLTITPQLCDDVTGAPFQSANNTLSTYSSLVSDAIANSGTVDWYNSAADRIAGIKITTPITILNGQTFFFRATSNAPFNCINDGSTTFTVNALPDAIDKNKDFCENTVGFGSTTGIDLTSYEMGAGGVTNGGTTITRDVEWYEDDGSGGLGALISPGTGVGQEQNYTITTTKTVHAKIIDLTSPVTPQCFDIADLVLNFHQRPIDNPIVGNTSECTTNSIILYQVTDPARNTGSSYTWSVAGTPDNSILGPTNAPYGGGGTNTANFFVLLKFPGPTIGTVDIVVFETLNGCAGNNNTMTVTVNSAPPANSIDGATEVCSNQVGELYQVHAPNGTSTYTWSVTGATLASDANSFINVDFSTITPVNIQFTETSVKGCVGLPASLMVNVNTRPNMTSSNATTICSRGTPSLAFASDIVSDYNWKVTNIQGTVSGVSLNQLGSGDFSATFFGVNAIQNTSGTVAYVTFDVTPKTTAIPNCVGTTQSVILTVNPEPVVNVQGADACSNTAVNYTIQLTPSALPVGTQLSWSAPSMSDMSTQGLPKTIAASAPVHITDMLVNTSSGPIQAVYNVFSTVLSTGCSPATSTPVTINVNPQPIMYAPSPNVCSKSAIGVTFSASVAPDPVSTPINNYNLISVTVPVISGFTASPTNVLAANNKPAGYISNDIYTNLTNAIVDVTYVVQPVGTNNCLGANVVITVHVQPQPSLSGSLDENVCSGQATGLDLVLTAGSASASGFNIVSRTIDTGLLPDAGNAIVNATTTNEPHDYLINDKFTNTTSGNLKVVYQVVPVGTVALGSCPGNPPQSITITILPEPVLSTATNPVCSSQATGYSMSVVTGSIAASSFDIISTVPDALLTTVISATVPQPGAPAGYLSGDKFINKTPSPLYVTYNIRPHSTDCSGQIYIVKVQINPEPILVLSSPTVCSEGATNLNLSYDVSSVAASTYNITNRVIASGLSPNVLNANVPASGKAPGYLANDKFTNLTAGQLTVTYSVVPVSAASCAGGSQDYIVQINPEPFVSTSLNSFRCSKDPINLTLATGSSSAPAATYNVLSINFPAGLTPGATNKSALNGVAANYLLNDTYTNTTNSPIDVQYSVTATTAAPASCTGQPQLITITINPEPVVSTSLGGTVCSGTPLNLNLNTNGVSVGAASYNIISVSFPGLTAGGTNEPIGVTNKSANYLANDFYTNVTSTTQVVSYTVQAVSAAGCSGPTQIVSFTINPEPVLAGPFSSSACSGNAIGLNAAVTGSSVSVSGFNVTARTIDPSLTPAGSNVAVTATGVLSGYLANDKFTNKTTANHNVTYTIEPVGSIGSCVGASQIYTVQIIPEPILLPPTPAITVCSGSSIGLTLATDPSSVGAASYNVLSITPSSGLVPDAGNVTAATTTSITYLSNDKFVNTTGGQLTVSYFTIPISSQPCTGSGQSIVVNIKPEPVVTAVSNIAVCSGESISPIVFSSNTGGGEAYSWTNDNTAIGLLLSGSGNIPGYTAPVNVSSGSFVGNLTVSATKNSCTSTGANSKTFSITIYPQPLAPALTSVSLCSGQPVNQDLQNIINAVGGNSLPSKFKYTLTADLPSNLSPNVTPGTFDRTTASTALITDLFSNYSSVDVTLTYTVTPFSTANNCQGDQFVFKVVIHPEPVGQNYVEPLCLSTLNFNIQSKITNGVSSEFTYTVSSDNPGVPPAADRTSFSNLNITDVYSNTTGLPAHIVYTITARSLSASPSHCVGSSTFTYTVAINAVPTANNTSPGTAVCSGTSLNIDPIGNITNGVTPIFSWTANPDGGFSAQGPLSGTGNITGIWKNKTNTVLNVLYTVTPSVGSCPPGTPFTINQPVDPEPVMTATLATPFPICSTNSVSSNPTAVTLSVSNAVPSLYNIILKSQDSGVTGSPTVGNGLGAAAISTDKFGNTTSEQLKVIYTVTPVATTGSCLGSPIDITIQINPEPVLFSSGVPQVCSNNSDNPAYPITLVFGTNGTSAPVGSSGFKLITAVQYSTGGPFSTTLPTGFTVVSATPNGSSGDLNLIKQDTYKNTSNVSVTVRYAIQATSVSGGCLSVPINYDVIINPEPILSPGTVPICSGVAPGALITLSAASGSVAIAKYDLKQVLIQTGLTPNGSNVGLGVYNNGTFLGSDIFINTTSGQLQTTYNIAPITAAGCTGADQDVLLKVNPAPAVSANLNTIVCSGSASGITLATTASSAPARGTLGYFITNIVQSVAAPQLQPNALDVNPNITTGVATNYILGDKFVNNTNATQTVTYSVQAITAALCTGPIQNIVLTVEPTIVATPTPLVSGICSNGITSVTLSSPSLPTAGPISFSYLASSSIGGQLSGFVPSVTNLPSGAVIADNLLNSSDNSADVTYSITPVADGARGGSGCTGSPVPVTVHVDPIPKLVASPSIQTICEGVASNIVLTSSTSPSAGTIKFNVVSVVSDPGLSSVTAAGPYTNGQSIADVWSNTNTSMSTSIYTLQPVVSGGLGCVGNPVTITLNVNPSPNVVSTIINPTLVPAAICSNDLVNISLAADVSATVNSWTASVTAGTASGLSSGSGDLIFQTLKNTGVVPATVRYHVTPKASGCTGPAIDVDVNVNPTPDVVLTAPTPVCYGNTLNVPLTSSVAGVNFNWTVDDNNSGVDTTPASGAAINYVVKDTLTSAEDFLSFTITAVGPGATACASAQKMLSVIASPKMNGVFQNDPTWLCTGSKDFLQISLQGQAPFTLQYTDGTSTFTSTKVGNFKSIQIQPFTSTTYTLVSLKDNLGCTVPLTSSVVYTVNYTDATYSILSPTETCTPDATLFTYNQQSGTQYDWQWGDGNDSTYVATTDVLGKVIKHTFINSSLTSTLSPHIVLTTSLDDNFPNGCAKSSTQAVTVYAQLKTKVAIDKNVICSGDEVRLSNQTVGVPSTGNKWFYHDLGNTSQELEVRTTSSTNYTLSIDSTMSNPHVYEIVYQSTNTHCPADTAIQVTVYKSIKANFTDVVPYFVGGNSTAVFNNTSHALLDWPQFRFDWSFGLDSNPATLTSSSTPIDVNYSSPGPRDVTLLATNIAAESAGLTCASTITKTITVLLAPLLAEFKVDPKQACYPTKITVIENLSTGDLFKWSVIDRTSSDTVASSNAPFPIFSISNEGSYIVRLLTSSSYTGQTAVDTAHIVLYPKPEAIFDAFPTTVYVPDQEVTTINGSGNTATQYLWDFGDGGTSTDYQPTYKYKFEGVDSLKFTAQYDHGSGIICSATNYKIITAKQGGVAKIPNAFTPSSAGPSGGVGGVDLYNYVFLPQVKGVEEFNMQIFDRWGNLIFESNNQSIGWDGYDPHGKLMPSGVYVYKLTLRLSDQQRTTQVGDVTLIR